MGVVGYGADLDVEADNVTPNLWPNTYNSDAGTAFAWDAGFLGRNTGYGGNLFTKSQIVGGIQLSAGFNGGVTMSDPFPFLPPQPQLARVVFCK